jgi:hypothetical protein
MTPLRLRVLPGLFAVCRLSPDADLPQMVLDAMAGGSVDSFISLTRTSEEISLVLPENLIPEGCQVERGWRCLKLLGLLDFGLVGILAGITKALADAGISLFAVSTYDTDYIMVKEGDLSNSLVALQKSGITIEPPLPYGG